MLDVLNDHEYYTCSFLLPLICNLPCFSRTIISFIPSFVSLLADCIFKCVLETVVVVFRFEIQYKTNHSICMKLKKIKHMVVITVHKLNIISKTKTSKRIKYYLL